MAPKKKDTEDYLGFEMEGKVWIVSREKKVITYTLIENEVVLGIIANALAKAVGFFANKIEKEKKQPKPKKKK